MLVLKMAWRNVWRNHRRSAVTIAAMTLALMAELMYAGLVAGMIHGMEDDATEMDLGDVQVFQAGYLTRPSLYEAVEDADTYVEALDAVGYRATARLLAGGLVAFGDASSGAQFVGVDPARDAATMALDEAMGEGDWLDADDVKGVVIGRGLSRTLGAGLGDELLVVSQGADGSIANDLLAVRGILLSVAASMDRGAILMTEEAFRELMVFPEGAHKIVVRRPKDVPLDEAKAVVAGIVGAPVDGAPEEGGVDVMTWKELSPFLAQWMDSVSGVVAIVYFIVYVAVAILILNAMLMAVFERIREFGVLKAIGFGPFQVFSIMVLEGLIQACVAAVLGTLLALPGMIYLQQVGIDVGALGGVRMVGMTMPAVWRGYYTLESASLPVVMLFFIVLGAVVYPAFKAARIRPVEAMHHA